MNLNFLMHEFFFLIDFLHEFVNFIINFWNKFGSYFKQKFMFLFHSLSFISWLILIQNCFTK